MNLETKDLKVLLNKNEILKGIDKIGRAHV